MKKILVFCLLMAAGSQLASAQLTQFQKTIDFQTLVALFDKNYALYDYKKNVVHYDGLSIAPWLDRVSKSTDDMDFFEICSEYVAKYQDGHTGFGVQSNFSAVLGFTTDIYGGKVLVDGIDRKQLSATDFPFAVGDELVSVDGKTAEEWITYFTRFLGDGNPVSARRLAAAEITTRFQQIVPRAQEIGDTAAVAIKNQAGTTTTYTIPWVKTGTPYTTVGPVRDPLIATGDEAKSRMQTTAPDLKPWMKPVRESKQYQHPKSHYDVFTRFGAVKPAFDLAAATTFVVHVGKRRSDWFYSGTITTQDGLKLGFIRIPTFDSSQVLTISDDVDREIAYFHDTTDGLIIDLMANGGGDPCEVETILQNLISTPFSSATAQFRVTWSDLLGLQDSLSQAQLFGDTQDNIDAINKLLDAYTTAFSQNRGLTSPVPLCGASKDLQPATDDSGKNIAYTKPIMVLTDELSASAAEIMAAVLQDSNRVLTYGGRTEGLGGSRLDSSVGFYSEGAASLAHSILSRSASVTTPDFGTSPYIENVGVRPNVTVDYMTKDNLLNNGKGFVDGFIKAFSDYIKSQK